MVPSFTQQLLIKSEGYAYLKVIPLLTTYDMSEVLYIFILNISLILLYLNSLSSNLPLAWPTITLLQLVSLPLVLSSTLYIEDSRWFYRTNLMMFFFSLKILSFLDMLYKAMCELAFAYLSTFHTSIESMPSYLWHFVHRVSPAWNTSLISPPFSVSVDYYTLGLSLDFISSRKQNIDSSK